MNNLLIGRSAPAPDPAVRPNRAPGGTETAGGGELRSLTGLRIVAAVWVVAFHFHFTALPGVAEVSALLGPLVVQGSLGVDLFFVLSGFVIAYTYLDVLGPRLRLRGAGRFVWARAGRMWPAYVLVLNLFGVWLLARSVLGSGPDIAFQAVQPTLGWGEWLQQVLLVQMWNQPFLDGASWVGPTWSISAEWLAYLLFPVTALVFFRLRRLPAVVLAFGAVALMSPMAASFVLVGSPYYPFSWLVRVVCGFSAGVLALLAVRRLRDHPRNRTIASVLAGTAIGGVVAALAASVVLGPGAVGAVTLLFPVLVGSLALADRGPARLLASRPMVHGGRISYALYLVHIPMFEVFWLALRRYGGDGFLAAGSPTAHLVALGVLVATVPAAHLLYTLVEQPARRWMRALPGVRRRRTAMSGPVTMPGAPLPTGERVDSGRARLDPVTTLLPRLLAEPVDTDRARLDPPTARLPRQAPARPAPVTPATGLPVRTPSAGEVFRPVLDGPVPRQRFDTADWVLTRLRAARDAGHGDDHEGDRLAGNLMAAARLRETTGDDLFAESGGPVREHGAPPVVVPAPTSSELSDPELSGASLPVPGPSAPDPSVPGPFVPGPGDDGARGAGGALLTAEPDVAARAGSPARREAVRREAGGSRTGVERCGRGRHSAHDSAATPIVATAAASVRGTTMRRRRRPTHGLHNRDD